jgi:uncharacterized membrane-anchored protein YitT (DUF2179 family)
MTKTYHYLMNEMNKNTLKNRTSKKSKKGARNINVKELLKNSFLILSGVLSASIGLKCFLLPNAFIDGGVTGISLITNALTDISFQSLHLPTTNY